MQPYILIADDDPFLTEMFKKKLKDEHIDVRTVHDGKRAIEMMDAEQPALVLLDLLMPEKDGYAVLEHAKSKKYDFPILVVSNLQDPSDHDRCLSLGAREFVQKSTIDMEELAKKVASYC